MATAENGESGLPAEMPVTRSRARMVVVISCLFLSLFTAALDFTITSPAIPTIVADFKSGSGYTWIGSAYLLANATSSPVWGKLSDIWGRKAMLLTAVAVFFIGSLLCALSTKIAMFLSGRAIQGSGSGGVVILVNICITDLFDIRTKAQGHVFGTDKRGMGISQWYWSGSGGVFTQLVSWRWNWWINLPCCALAFVLLIWLLNVDAGANRLSFWLGLKRIDWLGIITILGVTLMLLLGLNFGGVTFPWKSPTVICLIVLGAILVPLFVLSEAKYARHPIMPLRLFKNRSNVAAFLVYISAFYFLPLFFQAAKGTSIMISGVLILPIAIVQCLMGIATGFIIKHTGHFCEPIWAGMAILTLGFGLFIMFDYEMSIAKIAVIEAVAGLGVGMNFQSPLIALQSHIDPADFATATATFGFIRNIATSLSVVIGGMVFQHGMQSHSEVLANILGSETAAHFDGASAEANVDLVASLPASQRDAVRGAYVASLRSMWILYLCVAAVGLLSSFMVSKKPLHTVGSTDRKSDAEASESIINTHELRETTRN
ncbi:uncharacterized protein N7500_001760 [Penicillium coprophilum]|uniref:uncharacterized protein n=1 Tax=Penicillium coprophilum TaxID=36646 RepID=UPI002382A444|nr:uncharacterized protein N7500_001760 [Penicillium coprophilum]KAJ5173829.1 hypothetical protein N7500_001760 [Penicillium coprophilum]